MENDTRVFSGAHNLAQEPYYGDPLHDEGNHVVQGYEEDFFDEYEAPIEDEQYMVYSDEDELDEPSKPFFFAMNIMDVLSVLAGVVVIFILTALIISLLTWLRTDITDTLVIFQSRIL